MEYIFIIALGFFITEFEPLHFVLDAVADKLPKSRMVSYLFGMFTCWQCTTFCASLAIYQSFEIAVISSLAAVIIEGWMQKK
jgi:uncharacterized membrane protein